MGRFLLRMECKRNVVECYPMECKWLLLNGLKEIGPFTEWKFGMWWNVASMECNALFTEGNGMQRIQWNVAKGSGELWNAVESGCNVTQETVPDWEKSGRILFVEWNTIEHGGLLGSGV
ncbi:Adhesion G-Protein Coupled Receptor V1 [Manis pentadactyla]|nr:Adhesion G-Protein Coupled Receptor V1 [Manis pentadactyla]